MSDATPAPARAATVTEPREIETLRRIARGPKGDRSDYGGTVTGLEATVILGYIASLESKLQVAALAAAPVEQERAATRHWRCFSCDEVFTDPREAAKHFSPNGPNSVVACLRRATEAQIRAWTLRAQRAEKALAEALAALAAAPGRDEGAMDDLPISATGPDPDAESDPSLTDEAWESMRREMHEMHEQESAEPPRDGAAGLLASPDVLFLRELAAHIEQHEEPTLGNWRRTRDRLNKIADLLAKSEAARREAEAERDRYEHFWAMAECERVQRAVERDEARAALATAEVLIDRYARHDCQQFMRCDCGLSAALRMWKSKLAAARPAGAEGTTP